MEHCVIGVMGSGTDPHEDFSISLGQWLGTTGHHLLTGAGQGVMLACARAFVETRRPPALSIGVVPTVVAGGQFEPKPGYPNPFVDLTIVGPLGTFEPENPDRLTRNYINVLTSHAIVALPGEKGTRNEVQLAVRFGKPIILFGPVELFDGFDPSVERTADLERVKHFINSELSISA